MNFFFSGQNFLLVTNLFLYDKPFVPVKVWVILCEWSSGLTRDPCQDTFQNTSFDRQICGLQQATWLLKKGKVLRGPYHTRPPCSFFLLSRDCLRLILTPWVKRRNDIISISNPSVKHCSIQMNPNHWNIWQYSKGSSELDTHTRATEEKDEHCFPVCCKAFDLIIIW